MYMAPELVKRGGELTTAVDVYGLGAVLYELLAGRPPFRAGSLLETLFDLASRDPERPRSIKPELDADLEAVCLKCLEKEPGRRYGSAEALANDLDRWLRDEPVEALALSGVAPRRQVGAPQPRRRRTHCALDRRVDGIRRRTLGQQRDRQPRDEGKIGSPR